MKYIEREKEGERKKINRLLQLTNKIIIIMKKIIIIFSLFFVFDSYLITYFLIFAVDFDRMIIVFNNNNI